MIHRYTFEICVNINIIQLILINNKIQYFQWVETLQLVDLCFVLIVRTIIIAKLLPGRMKTLLYRHTDVYKLRYRIIFSCYTLLDFPFKYNI